MPEQGSPDERARPTDGPDLAAGFSTRAIRAAHRLPSVEQRPTSVPISQTVTFSSGDAEELGAVLTGERPGYAYGRIDNPTTAALGRAVAELEGAEDGIALPAGMAAIRGQMTGVLSRLGVATEFVDVTDPAAVERALAAAPTRVLYAETIANPTI